MSFNFERIFYGISLLVTCLSPDNKHIRLSAYDELSYKYKYQVFLSGIVQQGRGLIFQSKVFLD